jgi:hypothetical protein
VVVTAERCSGFNAASVAPALGCLRDEATRATG